MGLSSGEYGGRKRSLHPVFWAAKDSRFLEWNEALSITITVPCSKEGRSWLENQNSKSLLTLRHIPIFPIQICIHTAFIHIGDLFRRYIFDLFLICRYLLPILLLVAGRLFFLVILCRRNASRMPLSLHPNASAISDWYASGCSATYAFSFSGSIFRKLLCSFFFSKFPVSFSCFSHFCIVDLDTLKT